MLAAVASGDVPDLVAAMSAMSGADRTIDPASGDVRAYHEQKHRVFHRMHQDQLAYRALMETAPPHE
jgi:ribulose kinase